MMYYTDWYRGIYHWKLFVPENSHYFKIDLNNPLPIYHQIQENVLDLIRSDVLRAGDALPAERELSEAYGVSRMTVRQAITALASRGVLRRLHGVGTFVTEKQDVFSLAPTASGFSERIRSVGMTPTSRVIALEIIQATPSIAKRLALEPNAPVIFLRRLRMVNDEPLMVEKSYLSQEKYPELVDHDFGHESLYSVLAEHYTANILETEQTLEPTLLTPQEGEYFGLIGRHPAMLVHITAYTEGHQPVEFCKSVIRGDRCRYYFTVNTQTPIIFR
jgi:GntR family transcriptional regulator, N-acetylglucosamine utilization regulator